MSVDARVLRRVLLLLCSVLVALAVLLVLSLRVSEVHGGTTELLDGRADTSALALPLALFVVGTAGLLAALGWRPRRGM